MTVTPEQVRLSLGSTVSPLTDDQIQVFIKQAYDMVKFAAEDAGTVIELLDPERVDLVVTYAVASIVRANLRRDDARQTSVSVDGATVARMYDSAATTLDITPWINLLGLPRYRRGAFSIRLDRR